MYRRLTVPAVLLVLVAGGCTADENTTELEQNTRAPEATTVVIEGETPVELAVGTSAALFASAAVVVLTGADEQEAAASVAEQVHAPLLLIPIDAGTAVAAEIARLRPRTLLTVGTAAHTWATTADTLVATEIRAHDGAPLPVVAVPAPLDDLLVLTDPTGRAAAATARAAGARVLELADPDPRRSDEAITALKGMDVDRLVAVGSAFGSAERVRSRVETAATGVTLPGGNQVVFPGRRMVALYGHPGNTAMGSLGEQAVDQAVVRAKEVAAAYAGLFGEPVVPAFELIATVAAASAGPDGNYSSEFGVDYLRPWVDAAGAAGIYVVLDLQPGRTDFLTQARLYEELLLLPHVGLALDPEWRLGPGEVHMVQIGSVTAAEINEVGAWLAELTRSHRLPQKVLMLHQFRLDMITSRDTLVTDYDELRVVIHADGFGSPGAKFSTWDALRLDAPANIWWGWKNFYDEDQPTFTPAETVAIEPSPVFVSYQ